VVAIGAWELGDLSAFYIASGELLRLKPTFEFAKEMHMWANVFLRGPEAAARFARDPLTLALLRRDISAVEGSVRNAGPDFWSLDWARDDAADVLVLGGRGRTLVDLLDARHGRELDPASTPAALIIALRQVGRNREAASLAQRKIAYIKGYRGLSPPRVAYDKAHVAASVGDRERAMTLLEQTANDYWWNFPQPSIVRFDQSPVFESLHGDPRFRRIVTDYEANIEREKQELAVEIARWNNRPVSPDQLVQ